MAANAPYAENGALEVPAQAETIKTITPWENRTGKETSTTVDTHMTSDVTSKARDLTSRTLDFLSNASNETLGACLVGLIATTWLILGRIGLVLIGLGGGIVLHATWEGDGHSRADDEVKALENRKRREKALDITGRLLDWRTRAYRSEDLGKMEQAVKSADFSTLPKETGLALTGLSDAVIRDYVKWWYGPVVPTEQSFPNSCQQVLTGFLLTISSHLSRKRPADTFLDFLTNSSSIVIVFLSELSSAFRDFGYPNDASETIREFLAADPSSSLANVLDREQQSRKLRAIADDILRTFLERSAYACEPVRLFLREILASIILDMTVTSCSRADFINEWIIYSLEEGSTELVEAFDAGVGGATVNGSAKKPSHIEASGTSVNEAVPADASISDKQASAEHKRTVSRAENAMEEAMQEAQRLSEMIAAEEAKREQSTSVISSEESTTAEATPTSSRDDLSATVDDHPSSETSYNGTEAETESKSSESVKNFTTFDQIISAQQPTALQASQASAVLPLTLYNASVSIFDDSTPNEKGVMRSKPTAEYLLQIEPASSQHPGWMIARKYPDFETLHEVLRRISVVSGVAAFAERHQAVPAWKNQTKAKLRTDLEHYLRDALSYQRLAESEGMKRFLEKDQALTQASPSTNKGGFGFPTPAAFETMGKGMLDVLASAPKGAAGGGKAIFGGMTGVLGVGQKRQSARSPAGRDTNASSTSDSTSTLPPLDSNASSRSSFAQPRVSQESPRMSINYSENTKPPPLPRRTSQPPLSKQNDKSDNDIQAIDIENPSIQAPNEPPSIPPLPIQDELHLPPPPSEIEDDFRTTPDPSKSPAHQTPFSTIPSQQPSSTIPPPQPPSTFPSPKPSAQKRPVIPLTPQETTVAIELFFATINSLYTLSSAWTLRLTLLNAAKSFLLRPSNPNLEAIRQLLQTTIIDANTSDTGIATLINKVRQNALPTEEERKAWPNQEVSEEERERRRTKARRLLVEKGMPAALTSVMGAAASGEALGRVFDAVQVEEVGRGLVFALVLQGVKALTQ